MRRFTIIPVLLSIFVIGAPQAVHAAEIFCASGNVACLIAAINEANRNGEPNTIVLEPGTYTLAVADNQTNPFSGSLPVGNGLPVITGVLTLKGGGANQTVIARDITNATRFRILFVADTGVLTLDGITITGGFVYTPVGVGGVGGGILNLGTATLTHSTIFRNTTGYGGGGGGGIFNGGTMTISRSTISGNGSAGPGGGGLSNSSLGNMTITKSTISFNGAGDGRNGAIDNRGTLAISNTTITDNQAEGDAAIGNSGTLTLTNSTVARNIGFRSPSEGSTGGIAGKVTLQNTILALNRTGHSTPQTPSDCRGVVTSLGNNIIGDVTGCSITLQPTDLTGDPGLGNFTDDGTPGNGRLPFLLGSPAIDAGNHSACLPEDQLDTPRRGPCDIGAIEFYPLVNDLVVLENVSTAFDPTPVPGGPAGTFRIIAEFNNTSSQTIGHRFAEVVDMPGGNLLLNADRGAGGIGARLTPSNSSNTPWLPGSTVNFEFHIGLQKQEVFTFFVNILGDPQN